MEMAQFIAQYAIELTQGKRMRNKVKANEQAQRIFVMIAGFIERNPQYR